MNENKQFYKGYYSPQWLTVCEIEKDGEVICTVALKDADFIIEILEENERLKDEDKRLKKENENLKHTLERVCEAW